MNIFLRTGLVLSLFFIFPNFGWNQISFELGGFAGIAQYQGDLAEEHIEIGETLISKGIYGRFHVNPNFTIRAAFYNGTVSGNDENAADAAVHERDWNFSSTINEFSLLGEWNILGIHRWSNVGRFKRSFTPIIFAGIGVSGAKTQLNIPEGQNGQFTNVPFPEPGNKDSFFTVPFGVAVRYDVTKYTAIGAEFGWRAIFSDYLDNVSENGRKEGNDWYSFMGLNISILFGQSLFD